MDLTQWLGLFGGLAGIGGAVAAIWRVVIDRRAGIDSKEIENGQVALSKDTQTWNQIIEVVAQLRADLNDARTRVSVLESKIGDQAVEIATRIDDLREKDARIDALNSDIVALLEHIHAGRQPPPPKLRGYRGEEETQ